MENLMCLLLLSSMILVAAGGDVCVSGHDSGPVFEEQPSSLIYPEGLTEGKVILSCQARASPAASYRWLVNGTEVPLGLDLRYTLVAGSLVISSPESVRDTGSYQCLAINRCGTIVSKAASVKFGYLNDFPTDSRSPQTAYEGAGTFLACRPPPHYPALSYRWFINEFPNFLKNEKSDGRWFVSQVTGNLYLAKAEQNDTGNYFCFTTINMDISSKSTFSRPNQLTVLSDGTNISDAFLKKQISSLFSNIANPRKSTPSIKVRFPAETYRLAGQTAQLECFAYGNPVPKLRWRKVDGLLPAKSGSSVEGPTLTLPDLSFDDEGIYECEAYNSQGSDAYQGRISVQAQPQWLQVMSDSEVEISSELLWSCIAAGKPKPSVRWLRNGQSISTQDRVEVNGARLKISNLALEDSGMYQCVAENKHGTIYSSAELRVQVQAPDFRLNPVRKLIPAARGGQVKIECRPRAAPKPSLFWSRGTELLTNSSRVTVAPDGVLSILNISRADEGKYTCFAENYLGKANSTGHLSVRDATKITLAPSNADINQGENVSLQCHAAHDPTMDLSFSWNLNGVMLDLEDSAGPYHRIEGKENIGDLIILNAQLSQAGVYTCTAQTVVDSASAVAKLVVRGPPGPPGGLLVKNVAETSVELRWSRGYDNHSPIGKYVIRGRWALSSQWRQMRTEPSNIEGNAESARVIGLMPWMDYEFQVIASNILGSGEPSMASHTVRTQQAAPTVAPSGLGGGGGDRHELIITWTPMAREYQNGDGFGYILAFKRTEAPTWTTLKIPQVDSSRYVYYNDSLSPYSPFVVKIRAYNCRGEGPFSQIAVVHSAEEEPTLGPLGINATALSAFEIQVSWDPIHQLSTDVLLRGYEIRYWRQHEREAAADRVRTLGQETSARVSGLRPSTRYHVAVLAYNSAGTGPSSPRTTVTTRKPPPNRRPGNISWRTDDAWVTVRWDHVMALHNESAVLGYKVLYKHEGQSTLKVLDKSRSTVKLLLPKDNSYVVLEIRSWGEGGDGPAHEIIVSRDSGTGMMVQNGSPSYLFGLPLHLLSLLVLLALISPAGLDTSCSGSFVMVVSSA
ncbi:contactin-2 isoform X1 [Takifugu rubripes]|uniref:contactin-2 isoform X1 n=1 Tax=Takifugu rubripes TaxID=31033 RepID=UPI0005D157D7|nr:contactin-2 isoform X1 [Takifugu rubripes]XP_029682831.1 contactin-2 isoform X1 [Takifugu rubripes]|eukprot:XP_011615354.1 PREDICTED: LOW QUALITY PROTEIN: contactin-2 [Takifugu rubripes]